MHLLPLLLSVWCVIGWWIVGGVSALVCDEGDFLSSCVINSPQTFTEPQIIDAGHIVVNAPLICVGCYFEFSVIDARILSSITASSIKFSVSSLLLVEGSLISGQLGNISISANDIQITPTGSIKGSYLICDAINNFTLSGNISASGYGYGANSGPGAGFLVGRAAGGAGYGTRGTDSCNHPTRWNGGEIYGVDILPYHLGSGGGDSDGGKGGSGGGLINITAHTLIMNSTARIEANGNPGENGNGSVAFGGGGGSGGSINILVHQIVVPGITPIVHANGGNGGYRVGNHAGASDGGNGSGGRIWVNATVPLLSSSIFFLADRGTTTCYPTGVASTIRSSCPPGYEHPPMFIEPVWCSPCARGYYSDSNGVEKCSICAPGSVSSQGASSCTQCGPGNYTVDLSTCGACAPGTISDGTQCTACRRGFVVVNNTCQGCAKDWYEYNRMCYSCPGAPENSSTCFPTGCSTGTFYNGRFCEPCALGSYGYLRNSTHCSNCSKGYFANTTGLSMCYACPANTDSQEGSSFCSPCSRGLYSPPGRPCQPCLRVSPTDNSVCLQFDTGLPEENDDDRSNWAILAIVLPITGLVFIAIVIGAILLIYKVAKLRKHKHKNVAMHSSPSTTPMIAHPKPSYTPQFHTYAQPEPVQTFPPAKIIDEPVYTLPSSPHKNVDFGSPYLGAPPVIPGYPSVTPNATPAPSAPPLAAASDVNMCSVCYERPKEMIFLPCGHVATCSSCANAITTSSSPFCCICRAPIQSCNRAFL